MHFRVNKNARIVQLFKSLYILILMIKTLSNEKGWVSLVSQLVKISCLQCRRSQFDSRVRKIPWRQDGLPTLIFLGFLVGSDSKESARNEGDLGSIPGVGKIPWRRKWLPTPVFLPRESARMEEPGGLQFMESQRVEHG